MRSSLAVLALIVFASCGSPTEPSDYEFGRVDVYVRDTSGAAVDGVAVRLDRTNGAIETAGGLTGTAGPPGYYFFLHTKGDFRVVITPPTGYELAPGQSASVPVTFVKDQTRTIDFVLTRR